MEKEVQDTAREMRVKGRRALAAAADVTRPDQVPDLVRETVSELGRIDILVNNAATRCTKPILEMSEEEWRTVIDSNMNSASCVVGPPGRSRSVKVEEGSSISHPASVYGVWPIASRIAQQREA
jgi:NAD(P)-dependent dehydrogenase (short-subunit alcohol dehydrogenase family)